MIRSSTFFLFGFTALSCVAVTLKEDFSTDPLAHGWRVAGENSLFQWNAANENLEVTWNTEKANSFFGYPLGTVLAKSDDFTVAFDLQIKELNATFGSGYAFELSAGLLNWADAIRTNFNRGSGTQSPNLCEFDYFPDTGFGATISPAIASSNSQFAASFTFPLELTTDDLFHIVMAYTANNQTLVTTMTRNGMPFGSIRDVTLDTGFADFRIDTLAVSSYGDNDPSGSILAQGVVDNFVVTLPDPPIQNLTGRLTNDVWQVEFKAEANWLYTLERTEDFESWTAISPPTPGVDGVLTLSDTNMLLVNAFFRIQANRP